MIALSERQLRAIGYRFKGLGKIEALKKAGYSDNYSETNSGQFWGRKEVAAEVKERRRHLVKKAKVDAASLIECLQRIVDMDIADCVDEDGKLLPLRQIPKETRKALSLVGMNSGVRVTTSDRLKAIEMIARLAGLYEEKVHITGEVDLKERLWEARRRVANKEQPDG